MTITFEPMSEERFNQYYKTKLKEYADEHVRAGNWSEENALENAQSQFKQLLPDGLETKDHKLFTVMDNNEAIGMLWVYINSNKHDKQAFIYDLELDSVQRGKGYGKLVLDKLDEFSKAEGISQIGLHVFAHNERALALYQKMGYEAASYNMMKKI